MLDSTGPGAGRRAAQERLQRIRLALRGALVDRARDGAGTKPGAPFAKGTSPAWPRH